MKKFVSYCIDRLQILKEKFNDKRKNEKILEDENFCLEIDVIITPCLKKLGLENFLLLVITKS